MIFLGLDGADWQLLDRYMAAGTMPHLAALVADGRRGDLAAFEPPLSPLLWTTMMTGASPQAPRQRTGSSENRRSDEVAPCATWKWCVFPRMPGRCGI